MEIILIKGKQCSGKTQLAKILSHGRRTVPVQCWLQSFKDDLISSLERNIEIIIMEGFQMKEKKELIKILKSFPLKLRKPFNKEVIDVRPSTIIITTLDIDFKLEIATQTITTERC